MRVIISRCEGTPLPLYVKGYSDAILVKSTRYRNPGLHGVLISLHWDVISEGQRGTYIKIVHNIIVGPPFFNGTMLAFTSP
jgi:hypothetical protein